MAYLLSRLKASYRSERLSKERTSYAVPIWVYRVARMGEGDGEDPRFDEVFWVRLVQSVDREE